MSPQNTHKTVLMIYHLVYNNHSLYCIKRDNQLYFLQKNIAQTFYNNTLTFNSICWTNKVEKINASVLELKLIRDNDLSEQGLKKSTLLSLSTLLSFSETIRQPNISKILQRITNNLVCVLFVIK